MTAEVKVQTANVRACRAVTGVFSLVKQRSEKWIQQIIPTSVMRYIVVDPTRELQCNKVLREVKHSCCSNQ